METRSSFPGSPFRVCYRFSSVLSAQPLLLYWRLVIIIDNVIRALSDRKILDNRRLQEPKVSSIHAADQIAMSAEQGRRSVPVVSTLHGFSLPTEIAAYSSFDLGEERSPSKINWLLDLLRDCLTPMNKGMKIMVVRHLDAVVLPLPRVVTAASLE